MNRTRFLIWATFLVIQLTLVTASQEGSNSHDSNKPDVLRSKVSTKSCGIGSLKRRNLLKFGIPLKNIHHLHHVISEERHNSAHPRSSDGKYTSQSHHHNPTTLKLRKKSKTRKTHKQKRKQIKHKHTRPKHPHLKHHGGKNHHITSKHPYLKHHGKKNHHIKRKHPYLNHHGEKNHHIKRKHPYLKHHGKKNHHIKPKHPHLKHHGKKNHHITPKPPQLNCDGQNSPSKPPKNVKPWFNGFLPPVIKDIPSLLHTTTVGLDSASLSPSTTTVGTTVDIMTSSEGPTTTELLTTTETVLWPVSFPLPSDEESKEPAETIPAENVQVNTATDAHEADDEENTEAKEGNTKDAETEPHTEAHVTETDPEAENETHEDNTEAQEGDASEADTETS